MTKTRRSATVGASSETVSVFVLGQDFAAGAIRAAMKTHGLQGTMIRSVVESPATQQGEYVHRHFAINCYYDDGGDVQLEPQNYTLHVSIEAGAR